MVIKQKFPGWFYALTVLLFLSNLFVFGLASLLFPSIPFPDMGHTEAAFPIQFFAVRHIAFAFPLLYGLLKRDITILKTCYSIFLVIAVLDVGLLLVNGYYIPIIGELPYLSTAVISIACFIVPVSLALLHLNSYSKEAYTS